MNLQFSKLLAVHFKSMLLHQLRILKPTSIKFLLWVSVLFPWQRKWLSIYYNCVAQPLSCCTYFQEHRLYREDEVVPWSSTNPLYPIMWGKCKHPSNPVLKTQISTSTAHPDASPIQALSPSSVSSVIELMSSVLMCVLIQYNVFTTCYKCGARNF